MKLRLRLALVSCVVALVAVGLTGAVLIHESRAYSTEQLLQKQQLLAQNRAFALGDSLDVAVRELVRLSHMAEVDLSDNDLRPEAALLAHAHRNSTLFNIGLQIEDAGGRCLWSEPVQPACVGASFANEAWFVEGKKASGAVIMSDSDGERIDVVVPIGQKQPGASGVLRGIIDPRTDRIIGPALTDALPPGTERALVSAEGKLIHPQRLLRNAGWEQVIAEATGPAGAFLFDENGQRWLFAHAPVAHAGFGLAFRWKLSSLDVGIVRELNLLIVILALGGGFAVLLALLSSRWQTQPLESLVLARTHELEAAQRSLLAQERLAAMGQAAAMISHELKNSLGALGMGVSLIAQEAKGAGLSRVHEQVSEEVARLRTLTDELLVFARTPQMDCKPHDLRSLAWRAVDLCREQAAASEVKLTQAGEPQPLQLQCDAERIQSVLVNLVHNAIEAVAWQEPQLPAGAREVRVTVQRHRAKESPDAPESLEVIIDDSGPGIAAAARAHLFEPFFTTKRNGNGLGLATAQRFVGAHGGRIEAGPSPLRGARFCVVLPVTPNLAAAAGAPAGKQRAAATLDPAQPAGTTKEA